MYKTILAFILCSLLTTARAEINLASELTKEEIVLLEKGEHLQKVRPIEGSSWPLVTEYLLVNATALEAMGIFSALDYQQVYVPNMIKSRPVKHISAVEVLTDYEMHVPFPLSNALYTHGSVVHQYGNDYELTWYKVKSTSTDEVNGSAYFMPYKNATLFRYRSYIRPKSMFGSFVKNIMLRDVKSSIESIRVHIEKLKKENSPLLSKYSEFITRSLKGEFVYKDIIEKQ